MERRHLLAGVDRHAHARPDAIALEGPGEATLTYRELQSHARALARYLVGQGIRAGDRVALLGAKSIHQVAAIYGVLDAGAAYVPLGSDWPTSRIELVLKDVGARAIIADREHEAIVAAAGIPVILWTGDVEGDAACLPRIFAAGGQHGPDRRGLPALDEHSLAYILYTSGSTGIPKGVMHTHGSALAFVGWAAQTLAIEPGDRLSSHAPFNFDISIFDIFVSSHAGAAIVLPPPGAQSLPKRFVRWLDDQRITTVYSVPGVWVAALHHSAPAKLEHRSLRHMIYAGEPMAPKHVLRLQQALPQVQIYNFYGPTETNVCTAFAVPRFDADHLPAAIPIGNAVSGDTATVEHGELIISGASVMAGYWGHEARAPGQPYATGDLVSWDDAMGGYVFLGRRDNMRKVRGFRVELGEIESCLLRHPSAAEAVATVDESDPMHHTLVAFVVPSDGTAGSSLELRKHCARSLPPYMVPRIIWRSDLPRTSTGKIDRLSLQTELATREGGTQA